MNVSGYRGKNDIPITSLKKLEITNHYIILFGDTNFKSSELDFIQITEKLENSVLVKFIKTGEEKWFSNDKPLVLYDHVPEKLIRKKKLNNF